MSLLRRARSIQRRRLLAYAILFALCEGFLILVSAAIADTHPYSFGWVLLTCHAFLAGIRALLWAVVQLSLPEEE